jgi:hypothetical protein
MWASIASLFRSTAPVAPPAAPPVVAPAAPPVVAPVVANGLRSMAEAHKDRDVLMNRNSADLDMFCLPVGPFKREEQMIEAVSAWASNPEFNGGGFGIFRESQKPAGKTKGPRRLLMCDRSGKVKQ